MSQGQPRRPQAAQEQKQEPIKYGDVFKVSGDIANKPVTKQDAAIMQTAENMVLGRVQKSGPAAVMQSAADLNVRRGAVRRDDTGVVARDKGVAILDAEVGGHRVITESVGGQVVGQSVHQFVHPDASSVPRLVLVGTKDDDQVTIGEALEAAAISAGEKPIEQTDAAAIQAAVVRATGRMQITPGGVAAKAQAAVSQNARTMRDEDKTKLGDVLADASTMLPKDKVVSRQDAERVIGAEVRNQTDLSTYPGGVAATMAAAAWLNQKQ